MLNDPAPWAVGLTVPLAVREVLQPLLESPTSPGVPKAAFVALQIALRVGLRVGSDNPDVATVTGMLCMRAADITLRDDPPNTADLSFTSKTSTPVRIDKLPLGPELAAGVRELMLGKQDHENIFEGVSRKDLFGILQNAGFPKEALLRHLRAAVATNTWLEGARAAYDAVPSGGDVLVSEIFSTALLPVAQMLGHARLETTREFYVDPLAVCKFFLDCGCDARDLDQLYPAKQWEWVDPYVGSVLGEGWNTSTSPEVDSEPWDMVEEEEDHTEDEVRGGSTDEVTTDEVCPSPPPPPTLSLFIYLFCSGNHLAHTRTHRPHARSVARLTYARAKTTTTTPVPTSQNSQ